jgi:hypothetical protein
MNLLRDFMIFGVVAMHDFCGADAEFDKGHGAILASGGCAFEVAKPRPLGMRMFVFDTGPTPTKR